MTKALGIGMLSALISIGAGIYLLTTQAVAEDSIIESIMHGMGAYFIAKGLYMGASVALQEDVRNMLRAKPPE
jgi:D-alanyl-lipoteichoic acid acyltransferase DltB (MBOAT superfamily)